jgi:hypothetical protein
MGVFARIASDPRIVMVMSVRGAAGLRLLCAQETQLPRGIHSVNPAPHLRTKAVRATTWISLVS